MKSKSKNSAWWYYIFSGSGCFWQHCSPPFSSVRENVYILCMRLFPVLLLPTFRFRFVCFCHLLCQSDLVGCGERGARFIGFMWSLWRTIGILCCRDYHFYLYSFKKTIMAIPWISHISVLYIFIASFVRTIIPYTQHTYIKTLHILTSGNRNFSHNTHKYAHRERSLPSSLTRKGTRTHSRTANRTHHKYCMHLKMVKSSSLYFAHSQLWITVRGCKKSFWFLCFIMF